MFTIKISQHCLTTQRTRLVCCFIPARVLSNSVLSRTHSGSSSEFLSTRPPAQPESLPAILLVLRIKESLALFLAVEFEFHYCDGLEIRT